MTAAIISMQPNYDAVQPVFRDHSMEVIKLVSYSRWSLNAGSISLV